MNRSKLPALAIVLALGAAACSSTTDDATPSAEPSVTPTEATSTATVSAPTFEAPEIGAATTYEGDGFSIDHPKNWDAHETGGNESGQCKPEVCITAAPQDGQVPAIIAVTVYKGYNPENLQTAWNQVRQLTLRSTGVSPKTVPDTQGNTTMADLPAKTATYTLSWGLIPATAVQTMTLDDSGTAYVVTTMSSTDIWEDVQPVSDDAVGSFTLT